MFIFFLCKFHVKYTPITYWQLKLHPLPSFAVLQTQMEVRGFCFVAYLGTLPGSAVPPPQRRTGTPGEIL